MDTRRFHPRRLAARFTPTLGMFFLAVLLTFTGFGVFFAPLPAYLAATGLGSSGIFGLYLLLNAGAVAFFAGAAGLVGTYEAALLHAMALLTRGIIFPLLVLVAAVVGGTVTTLALTGVVFVALGLTWAVIAVTAGTLVTRLAPAGIRGEAFGLYSAVSALAGGIGGLLGGWLGSTSYATAFVTAGGLVVAGSVVVFVLVRPAAVVGTPAPDEVS